MSARASFMLGVLLGCATQIVPDILAARGALTGGTDVEKRIVISSYAALIIIVLYCAKGYIEEIRI
jgi:hypothetical protein